MRHSMLALAAAVTLAAPSHALFGWGEKKADGPLGAVLAEVAGPVTLKRAAGGGFARAAAQTALEAGDVVKTAAGGRAVIVFLDGSKMQLKDASTYSVASHSAKKVSVKIDVGTLQFWITKVARSRRYEMRTPTAVASVRGTQGEINVAPDGSSNFQLFEGSLGISDARGVEVRLEPNQQVTADPGKGLTDAKVEATPAGKTMEPPPAVAAEAKPAPEPAKAEEPKTEETKAEEPAAEEPKGEEPAPTAETTTANEPPPANPAQDEAISSEVSPSSP